MDEKLLFAEQAKEITKMNKNRIVNRLVKRVNKNILKAAKRGITIVSLDFDDIDNEILETIIKMCNDNGFKTGITCKQDNLTLNRIRILQIDWRENDI